MQHIWNVSAVLHEALQGLQIRYASLSNAKLILTKLTNLNINLCIMTQGLQIRYSLLPVHYAKTAPQSSFSLFVAISQNAIRPGDPRNGPESRFCFKDPTIIWEKGNLGALGSAVASLLLSRMQKVDIPFSGKISFYLPTKRCWWGWRYKSAIST